LLHGLISAVECIAERRAGEMLAGMEKAKGGWAKESCGAEMLPQDEAPTLSEIGITKRQSSDWQAVGGANWLLCVLV